MSLGAGADGLALGVKSRLSSHEMEVLRAKLAQAAAYDHVANDAQRAERHARALHAAKPMTKIYRRVDGDEESASSGGFRPGRKTLTSIRYEAAFSDAACDALRVRPPASKGISVAAKTRLQDEYVTRPRHVSSVPVSLMGDADRDGGARAAKSGKRAAPAAIPQLFIG